MKYPANVVKIDKSFTDKVMVDNKGEFVSQMGKFIRAAKEEIVVEGIETEEQRQFLESHGFEYGQGYLFDRPDPADEFENEIFINLCFWQVFYCRVSSNVYNFVLCFVQSEFFTTDKLNAKM